MYEVFYNMISVIAFTCSMILIVPFIKVYTRGITDANYIRYTFGILLVISEYIWAIRLPYSSITLSAGHFKETRIGAWVECILNIIISLVLVKYYGLIGVTIGTIVAMTVRTIEFIYHTNKYILSRSMFESIKKIVLVIIETLLILLLYRYIPHFDNINYINWIINAIIALGISIVVVLPINFVFFRNEFKQMITTIKRILKRKAN